jgi:hypothetical protein
MTGQVIAGMPKTKGDSKLVSQAHKEWIAAKERLRGDPGLVKDRAKYIKKGISEYNILASIAKSQGYEKAAPEFPAFDLYKTYYEKKGLSEPDILEQYYKAAEEKLGL